MSEEKALSMDEIGAEVLEEMNAEEVQNEDVENLEVEETEKLDEVESGEEVTEEAEQNEEQEDQEPELPKIEEAPNHWNTDLKQSYADAQNLPPEIREQVRPILDKMRQGMDQTYKGMEQHFNHGMSQIRAVENWKNDFVQQATQIDPSVSQDPNKVFEFALESITHLNEFRSDPVAKIRELAKLTNVDLETIAYEDPQDNQNPNDVRIQQLEEQIRQLTQPQQPQVNQQQLQQQQEIEQKVNEFAMTQDNNGQLKYPHFTEPDVQQKMIEYGSQAAQKGQMITPEIAYLRAVRELGKDTKPTSTTEAAKATPVKRVKKSPPVNNLQNNLSIEDITRQELKIMNMG